MADAVKVIGLSPLLRSNVDAKVREVRVGAVVSPELGGTGPVTVIAVGEPRAAKSLAL